MAPPRIVRRANTHQRGECGCAGASSLLSPPPPRCRRSVRDRAGCGRPARRGARAVPPAQSRASAVIAQRQRESASQRPGLLDRARPGGPTNAHPGPRRWQRACAAGGPGCAARRRPSRAHAWWRRQPAGDAPHGGHPAPPVPPPARCAQIWPVVYFPNNPVLSVQCLADNPASLPVSRAPAAPCTPLAVTAPQPFTRLATMLPTDARSAGRPGGPRECVPSCCRTCGESRGLGVDAASAHLALQLFAASFGEV